MMSYQIRILQLIITILLVATSAQAQVVIPTHKDSINQVDKYNRKQGFWHYKDHKTLDDWFPYTEYGYYIDDRKNGPWVRVSSAGELQSIETFFKGQLSGKVQYFDKGRLSLEGYYIGNDPDKETDTISIINPITEHVESVVVRKEQGSLKHGEWKYYDPISGRLEKVEIYQANELVKTIEYFRDGLSTNDSTYKALIDQNLPHNIDPTGKKYQKGKVRKSLTQ